MLRLRFPFFSILFIHLLLLQSCMPDPPPPKRLNYQNIIILSDLSDRVDSLINGTQLNGQYPPKDLKQIEELLQFFRNECVKPGEKIDDMSSVAFTTFSRNDMIAAIDIGKFDDLYEKQQFVNSKGVYRNKGLDNEIKKFNADVKKIYMNERNQGLDLISILIDKIENKLDIKQNVVQTTGVDSVFKNFENHIYIFTDGYLEYQGKKLNSQYYFGVNEIGRIRDYCKQNDVDISTALKNDKSLGLPKAFSRKNHLITLHVVETDSRDYDNKKLTYRHGLTFSDNSILKAVWRNWAIESGFKDFKWNEYPQK